MARSDGISEGESRSRGKSLHPSKDVLEPKFESIKTNIRIYHLLDEAFSLNSLSEPFKRKPQPKFEVSSNETISSMLRKFKVSNLTNPFMAQGLGHNGWKDRNALQCMWSTLQEGPLLHLLQPNLP